MSDGIDSDGTEDRGRTEAPEVIPLRHPIRWISGALVLFLGALLALSLARNPNIEWGVVGEFLTNKQVLRAVGVTLELSLIAQAIGIIIGLLIAVFRLSGNPILGSMSGVYVWFFRGTPQLVQLIFWFNLGILFPRLSIGIPFTDINVSAETNAVITAFTAAILGLGLNEGAYYAEIVRAGILSVDRGQLAATASLGMTFGQTMRTIVLPQAMRVIIPPTGNDFITMLKTSSLVAVIGGTELLSTVRQFYARSFKVIELLIVASIWYLVLTTIASIGQYFLERRFSRGVATFQDRGLISAVGRQLTRLRVKG